MAFQPIDQPSPVPYNPSMMPMTALGGRVGVLSATVPQPSLGGDLIVSGGTTLATGIGAYKYSVAQAAAKAAGKTIQPGTAAKVRFGMSNLMGAAKTSALFAGVISTAKNLIHTWNGTITGTRAAGNITADVAGAFGGGLIAAGTAGMITTAMAASLPATAIGLLGAGIGAVLYFGMDYLYRATGVHQTVSNTVTNFLDSLFGRSGSPGHGGM